MTIPEQILLAIAHIVLIEGQTVFTRSAIRKWLEMSPGRWNDSYSPIFQAMREDEPDGAPIIGKKYYDVLKRVARGSYSLTNYGLTLINRSGLGSKWQQAVLEAIHRYTKRHSTKLLSRQGIIKEELSAIVQQAGAIGPTPDQTLSRILQELRNEGVLFFLSNGKYLLLDKPVDVESEDLPDEALDHTIQHSKLRIGIVRTDSQTTLIRQRRGQQRVRELTLLNYDSQCALCEINDPSLLVGSHIARWTDHPEGRGNLSNTICLCRFHDVLFEQGFLSLNDDLQIIKRQLIKNQLIDTILKLTKQFRKPREHLPLPLFLRQHRIRVGFEKEA